MAGRSHQLFKHTYLLFAAGERDGPAAAASITSSAAAAADEFDESDVWGSPIEARTDYASSKRPIPSSRVSRKSSGRNGDRTETVAASSLPVNIPDWSKILREEYAKKRGGGGGEYYEEEESDGEDEGVMGGGGGGATASMIPPHEYLWRRRRRGVAASFSVHEGIGRTLKGRDLSRVRNAIWEKTGFQD